MTHLLRATCPPCGQVVPARYGPATYPAPGDRPEPAWWDWAVRHTCTQTDAQLDAIEAELEAQIPTRADARAPLVDLPR